MGGRQQGRKRSIGGRIAMTIGGLIATLAFAAAGHAAGFKVYVSNEKDNSISVVDSEGLTVIDTFRVGQRPRGITLTKDGRSLLVCASDDDTVQVVDLQSKRVVKTLPSGPDPELFVLHPSGNPLYIANEDDNLVTVVDIDHAKMLAEIPVGVEPEGMGVSPDGQVLVNTSETTNMVHFIDTKSFEVVDNVLVDSRPRFAEFSADGSKLWVTSEIGGAVNVINPADRKIIARITFQIPGIRSEAIQPVGIRVTRDGKRAFVALGPANRVAVINGDTFAVEKYLLVGQRVWQLAFTPDEKLLFTTNGVSNDVSVIDVDRLKVIKSIAVGRYPWGVAIGPNQHLLPRCLTLLMHRLVLSFAGSLMTTGFRTGHGGMDLIEAVVRRQTALLVFLASFGAAQARAAGDPADPDWPCVQRKVPTISAATVWTGPEIRNEDERWEKQSDVADLVRGISSRRLPPEEAFAAIDSFAATLGTDRNERLTLLFTGLLQMVNTERSEIMQGIERYTRRQRELAAKINAERAELAGLKARANPGREETAKIQDVEKAFEWDTRVFRERQESLAYVCESPVLLEQRLFSLARHVESLLE